MVLSQGFLQLLFEEDLVNALFIDRINNFNFITDDTDDSIVSDQH